MQPEPAMHQARPKRALGHRVGVSVSVTLGVLLISLFVSVAVSGTIIVMNYVRNTKAALVAAEEELGTVAESVREQTLALVRPIATAAAMTAELPVDRPRPDRLATHEEHFLFWQVRALPQVTAVYYGFADGTFLDYVDLTEDGAPRWTTLTPPEGSTMARLATFADGDGNRFERITFFDDKFAVTGSTVLESEYDPRTRPWYREAITTNEVIDTEPYVFATSGKVGLTLARRLQGGERGVFGVDITLESLSQFLRAQSPGDGALIALLTVGGDVLASAGISGAGAEDVAGRASLPVFAALPDPRAAAISWFLAYGMQPPGLMDIEGRTYVTKTESVAGPLGSRMILAMVVPADLFTARIRRLGRDSLFVSVGILLLSVPLIFLLSRQVTGSLKALAAEADAVRAFRLDGAVTVRSHINEVAQLADSMDRMKTGLRTFSLYVPRGLVQHLVEDKLAPELGGERREITVLFTDIADFTPVAEGLAPEVLMRRMSDYFEVLTEVLRTTDASVDKFMGDAVMAEWNAVDPDPDHVATACRATLQARAAVDAFNASLADAGLPPMRTRFGLHTGEAVVGNVGSSERMDFTALGATVNLAARLESLNKHYGTSILVSDDVARAVGTQFCLRSVALVVPKGVARPLRVHELLCELEDEASHPAAVHTEAWEAAFAAYVAGDWAAADAGFAALARDLPGDGPAALYAERARRHHAAPPQEWNGIEVFTQK